MKPNLAPLALLFAAVAAQALPVQLRSGGGTGVSGKLLATYPTVATCTAVKSAYTKPSHCYDVPAPSPAPSPCPAQPPAETRVNTCPTGTVGDWDQKRDYAAAPAPTCWVANAWTPTDPVAPDCPLIPPTPTPGGFDPVTGMPLVDNAKIPVVNPAEQYAAERQKLVPQPPTGSYLATQNLSTIGAFRELCGYAGMNYDDALVYPGVPGGSAHLHAYFGFRADAYTTSESIKTAPWSTCAGGWLNRSAYWMPAVIDTLDGTPKKPKVNNVYYKGNYAFPTATGMVSPPDGLHLIVGNAANTDPAKTAGQFICYGPQGQNPGWKKTIAAAYADGTCVTGGTFVFEIGFPNCWDGVNLDSPDHKSHVVNPVQDQTSPYAKHCPDTHPVLLPTISYNVQYLISDSTEVSRWYLSSDHAPAPAGTSAHVDYLIAWKRATIDLFVQKCLNEQRDCRNYLLGDNINMLY